MAELAGKLAHLIEPINLHNLVHSREPIDTIELDDPASLSNPIYSTGPTYSSELVGLDDLASLGELDLLISTTR